MIPDNDKERQTDLDRARDRAEKGRNTVPKADKAWEPTPIADMQEQIRRGQDTKDRRFGGFQTILATLPQEPAAALPPVMTASQALQQLQQELKMQAGTIAMMKAEQDQLRNRLDVAEEALAKALSQREQSEDQRVHIPMGKQSFGLSMTGTQATVYVGSYRIHGDKVIEFPTTVITLTGSIAWVYAEFARGASSGTIKQSASEPTTGSGEQIVRVPLYKLVITAVANVWTLERDCRTDVNSDTGM